MTIALRNVRYWPKADMHSCTAHVIETGRGDRARFKHNRRFQSLVAHSTRLDDHTAAWRHNPLTDQTTFASVRVIIPISVTVAAIPIRADADARTKRANLHAYALRVRCR